MLNIMIVEGYVRKEPSIYPHPEDENRFLFKFEIATLNGHTNEKNGKYIWLPVICFCGKERLDFMKETIHEGDYVSCVGKFSYMSNGKRYYSQLILDYCDKKFSKGKVPTVDTLAQDDNPNSKKEMNW